MTTVSPHPCSIFPRIIAGIVRDITGVQGPAS